MIAGLFALACGLVMLVVLRSLITWEICRRANDRLSLYLRRRVMRDQVLEDEIDALYDRLESPSYNTILLNPLIWTPQQAYPWLYALEVPAR